MSSSLHRVPLHGESFTFLNNSDLGEHTILSTKDMGMNQGLSKPKRTAIAQRNLSSGA